VAVRSRTLAVGILWALLYWAPAAAFQGGKQREDPNTRSVQGTVEDANGSLVEGAVVQLKNKKSLQVRSFITQKDGAYYFHGLSTDVDYELRAEHKGRSSATRTLSVFDSRRKAIINLKLEDKN
jgi:hypothetical protein